MNEGKQPAFPNTTKQGLTKREYFAGLALQGIMANTALTDSIEKRVEWAIKASDELLKQLEESK